MVIVDEVITYYQKLETNSLSANCRARKAGERQGARKTGKGRESKKGGERKKMRDNNTGQTGRTRGAEREEKRGLLKLGSSK